MTKQFKYEHYYTFDYVLIMQIYSKFKCYMYSRYLVDKLSYCILLLLSDVDNTGFSVKVRFLLRVWVN